MAASDVQGAPPFTVMLREAARRPDAMDMFKLKNMDEDKSQEDIMDPAHDTSVPVQLKIAEEDVVFLARKTFLAMQRSGSAEITLLRRGPARGCCSVRVSTEELQGSARAGFDFVPLKHVEVLFEAGERHKSLSVELLDDHRWDSTRLIGVLLTSPVGQACPARLGPIHRGTVLVSKTNRYPDGLPKDSPQLTQWQSMRSFLRNNARDRRWMFVATVVALGYKGVYGVVDCWILKLVINNALGGYQNGAKNCKDTDNEDGLRTSLTLAAIYVVALGLHHVADRVQLDLRGRGSLRMWLREKLLNQYLHLSERGAEGLAEGDFMNTMVCQVQELVEDGWHEALLLWESSVMIVTNIVFQIWLVAGKIPVSIVLLVFVAILPVILGSLACRERHLLHLNHLREHAEVDWMVHASELARARQLLQAYQAVNRATRFFQQQYRQFYKAHKQSRFYQQSSEWIPKWALGLILAGLYAVAPIVVEEYNISAGGLSSLVKSWLTLQKALLHFNESALCLQRSIAALDKISDVLNREDAVTMALNPSQRSANPESPADARLESTPPASHDSLDWSADADVILLNSVSFGYGQPRHSNIFGKVAHLQEVRLHGPMVFRGVTAKIPCSSGGVMLIDGPESVPHGGKTAGLGRRTLLRLLAGIVHPNAGTVALPPTRRWALVDRAPQLMAASLFRNLRVGRKEAWEWGGEEKMCVRGLPQDANQKDADILEQLFRATALACGVQKHLLEDLHVSVGGPGLDFLSTRDAVGISLTRAFLTHPDILLVDHLGDCLGPEFVELTLLPLLLRYASGGHRAVLMGAGHIEIASRLPEPSPPPVVIWSSLVLPAGAAQSVKYLLRLDGEGGVRVEKTRASS